jgi:hypothetical protein
MEPVLWSASCGVCPVARSFLWDLKSSALHAFVWVRQRRTCGRLACKQPPHLEHAVLASTCDPSLVLVPRDASQPHAVWDGDLLAAAAACVHVGVA